MHRLNSNVQCFKAGPFAASSSLLGALIFSFVPSFNYPLFSLSSPPKLFPFLFPPNPRPAVSAAVGRRIKEWGRPGALSCNINRRCYLSLPSTGSLSPPARAELYSCSGFSAPRLLAGMLNLWAQCGIGDLH